MLLPHGTIIIVVDGEKVEFHRNAGDEGRPELAPLAAPKFDTHNKDSGARHLSSSANHAARQLVEDAHAAAIADWLNAQAYLRNIEHVVVIAAPRTLGELRRRYAPALQKIVIGELDKDLSGRTGADILSALRAT